jgi:hypothetical protein
VSRKEACSERSSNSLIEKLVDILEQSLTWKQNSVLEEPNTSPLAIAIILFTAGYAVFHVLLEATSSGRRGGREALCGINCG